jgi:outer membrane protein
MKNIILGLAFLLFGMSTAYGQTKIAYVNTQAIIDTLPAKDTAEFALASLAKQYDESIRNLQMEIQGKQKEYEAKMKGGASPAQLELLQKSYERLVQEYQMTEQTANQEIQARRAQLLQPIVEKVRAAIGRVAKLKGYDAVIDNSAGMVVWTADDKNEITAAVILEMTKK